MENAEVQSSPRSFSHSLSGRLLLADHNVIEYYVKVKIN